MAPSPSTELDRATCLVLLATQSLGRLVFTRQALPDVLPVHYLLMGEEILLRLPTGSQAARAARDSVVAFETDHFDDQGLTGWSVTLLGRSHELTAEEGRQRDAEPRLHAWAEDRTAPIFAVRASRISGRRLASAGPGRAA